MPLLRHRDRIEGDLVIEVAFTDVSLSLGDAADDAVRADALAQVARGDRGGAGADAPGARCRRRVRRVRRGRAGGAPSCDALVASQPGVALLARAADCVPVLLADPATGWIAAVHSGRPGLAAGVVPAAVAAAARAGAATRRSPGSGPTCAAPATRCPPTCRSEVAAVVPEARSTTSWGTPALDLGAGVRAQLAAAGIDDVRTVDACTREDASWPSYRRDGAAATRFAGVIWSHR